MELLSLAWMAAAVAVLVFWFRVHAVFLVYLVVVAGTGALFGPTSLLTLFLGLVPLLYAVAFVGFMALRSKQPAFRVFAAARKWPLGTLLFDKLVLALLAPHKSLYGLCTRRWTESELVVEVRDQYWLRNPFQSVDVGALCGIGEMVAFGASQQLILQSGRRAIPVALRAEYVKKSKGRLTCRAMAQAPPAGVERHSVSAEVRDEAGDLCCTVYVDLHISDARQRK
jgi:acyl-coenzyme A thioesterase PaaI-like protein